MKDYRHGKNEKSTLTSLKLEHECFELWGFFVSGCGYFSNFGAMQTNTKTYTILRCSEEKIHENEDDYLKS